MLPISCWYLAFHIIWPWNCRWHVLLKCQLTFNRLQGVLSQKIECFITTAVIIWNPTKHITLLGWFLDALCFMTHCLKQQIASVTLTLILLSSKLISLPNISKCVLAVIISLMTVISSYICSVKSWWQEREPGSSKHRCRNDIKTCLSKEGLRIWTVFIGLRIGSSNGYIWTW
jgi:hypothetical protein